jgi:hypothetical protein
MICTDYCKFSDTIKPLNPISSYFNHSSKVLYKLSVTIILLILATTNIYIDTGKEFQCIPDEEMAIDLHVVTFYLNTFTLNSSPVIYR